MINMRKGTAALLATALIATAGCGADDAATSEDGLTTVRIASGAALVTDWDDYVAEDLGFYEDNDIKVDRISTQTAQAATQLLVAGGADIGRGIPPAIQANIRSSGGVELVSVADMMIRPPFVMYGSEGVTTYDDLRGKTVAMSTETDSTTIVTYDILKAKGLSQDDVDGVTVGGTADRYAGLVADAVAATALLPPVNLQAEKDGMPRIGYFPEDMGPEWKFSFTSVIASKDWAAENENTVVQFLKARDEALQWLADETNREEAVQILADNIDISTDDADQLYELMMTGDTRSFADRIGVDKVASERVLTDLVEQGFVPDGHSIDEFVDDSYADQARSEG